MHTFSPTSAQYEVQSWIFPHPVVRRQKDTNNPSIQRHSLHSIDPSMRVSIGGEGRELSMRAHRRWQSDEHQMMNGGLQGSTKNRANGEAMGWPEPSGLHSDPSSPDGKGRGSHRTDRRDRHSLRRGLVARDGNIPGDGTVFRRGWTRGHKEQDLPESKRHSSASCVPPEGEGDSQHRANGRTSRRRCHSQGHLFSVLAAETYNGEGVERLGRGSGRLRSMSGRVQSRDWESSCGPPLRAVSSDRRVRSSHVGMEDGGLLAAPDSPSRRPWKQSWVLEPAAPLPSTRHASNATQTDKQPHLNSPSRQPATALDRHAVDPKASLWLLSYKPRTMGHGLCPSQGVIPRGLDVEQRGSPEGRPQHPPGQQDAADSVGDEEDPDPALLGSVDYHDFLHGSSKATVPSRDNCLLPEVVNKTDIAVGDSRAPEMVLNDRSDPESGISKLAHKVTQPLSHDPFSEGNITSAATFHERLGAVLAERASSPEALGSLPRPELSGLADFPGSWTSSTISASSSLTTAPLLKRKPLLGTYSGPLSTISCKEIDQDQLKPFIGPLPPQQPPPDRPLPLLPLPSPARKRDHSKMSPAAMAGWWDSTAHEAGQRDTKGAMQGPSENQVGQKKGRGLRKKISKFFSSDQPLRSSDATAASAYQPLLLKTSQDTERLSLSDIFDDVYNATRGSLKPGRGSYNTGRSSYQKPDGASICSPSGDFTSITKHEHCDSHSSKGSFVIPPMAPCKINPPPPLEYPAIRGDLEIQRRLVKDESRATVIADTTRGIDAVPAFDRTVDLTWYRTAREERGAIISSIPRPSTRFERALTLFVEQYAEGRPTKKYGAEKRFPYFALPKRVRFKIIRYLVADNDTGRPILLNTKRQASPAWPDDAFVSLGSVLRPLQATMWACPRLRAEIMVVLLVTRRFHVIFSPWVKENTQPLPTTWLFRYLHLMQDVSLEIDMTKLGFGHSWLSTAMEASVKNIGRLVHKFTEEMLTRTADNSMASLTIHCRRYFGYRQGPNTAQRLQGAHKIGDKEDESQSIAAGQHGPAGNYGQPRNYNRRAPSLPPSAAKAYSGHLRHHADLPRRVPYVTEDQLSVASPLRALSGRIDSLRMVGFSEQWTYATHMGIWPEAEQEAVPDAVRHHHIHRRAPSSHSYSAPGYAVFLDYGISQGVHRYPPLPDSEPMVCVDYDRENGLFVELGSGKVVSVTKDGAEFHGHSLDPPTPSRVSASAPGGFTSPCHRHGPAFAPRASRIPTPMFRGNAGPLMQAMRNGTPVKAAAVLGLPGTTVRSGEVESLVTPTKERTNHHNRTVTGDWYNTGFGTEHKPRHACQLEGLI